MDKLDIQLKVGANIKKVRLSIGLTQVQLADLCERDKQAIDRIERGKINTSVYMLVVIAQALKVPVSQLLEGLE